MYRSLPFSKDSLEILEIIYPLFMKYELGMYTCPLKGVRKGKREGKREGER